MNAAAVLAAPAPAPLLPIVPAPAAAPRPRRVLACDSGRRTAAAVFDSGRLLAVHVLDAEDAAPAPGGPCPLPLCRARPCPHLASGPGRVVAQLRAAVELERVDLAAVEIPELWTSTPDPAGLLRLATSAGVLVGAIAAAGVPVLVFRPREYKGSVAKDVANMRTLAALTEAERALVPRGPRSGKFSPDALDSCQLGLHLLGRTDRWTCSPAVFADLVEPAPVRGKRRRPAAGPVQGGLAFGRGTGPNGEAAWLHPDDVESVMDAGRSPLPVRPRRRRR